MAEMKDPVCGMEVAGETAAAKREYKGQTFYFCSAGCAKRFDADPAQYVRQTRPESRDRSGSLSDSGHRHHYSAEDAKAESSHCHADGNHQPHAVVTTDANALSRRSEAEAQPTTKGTYTCPMHPEVVSDRLVQ